MLARVEGLWLEKKYAGRWCRSAVVDGWILLHVTR